jgi:hypothetical protein
VEFKVAPTSANEHFHLVKGARASCLIQENNPHGAYAKAQFYVSKSDWTIERVERLPIEVTEQHFVGRDIGLQQYLCAQEEGIAIAYLAWSRDGKTSTGPLPVRSSYNSPLSRFLEKQKQLAGKGRCLHYDSGHRCQEIIKAHSIQRNRSLSAIADKGHVYKLASNMSSLKKSKGRLAFEKCGVNKVSTFLGFCRKHDNELFEPIDNFPLVPTDQQVLLYAYRSLCRELFVKENSLELFESQLRIGVDNNAVRGLLKNMKRGTAFGLDNLKKHKAIYDNSLRDNSYSNARYVLFISEQKPILAFSGVFYPDFDFVGRQLQDLGDHSSNLQLITMCSAPMDCGWGFLFAWHVTSSDACVDFMRSLATVTYKNSNVLGDSLFRLVMTNCENSAISPRWWESLPESQKEEITSRASWTADVFAMTEPSYLMEGLEGICNWTFGRVVSNME